MGDWIGSIEEILDKERALLDGLLIEAQLKTGALKTGDIAEIDKIVNREQPLLLQLNAAEQQRLRLLEKEGFAGVSLSKLCSFAEDDHKAELKSRLQEMAGILRDLKRINALNSELTRARLEFYQFLSGAGRQGYENDGKPRVAGGSVLIDKKA